MVLGHDGGAESRVALLMLSVPFAVAEKNLGFRNPSFLPCSPRGLPSHGTLGIGFGPIESCVRVRVLALACRRGPNNFICFPSLPLDGSSTH